MPAEWFPHQRCFMAWPTRRDMWGELFEQAKCDYSAVAQTVARFEPVTMLCNPGCAREVVDYCGSEIDVVELPIDDSWTRDNGPIFVVNDHGELAAVDFGFDAWGRKFSPYARDADLTRALCELLGVRRYVAPIVLEGGAFFVDGEGTLVTTEGPLLERRNGNVSKESIEAVLSDYLGADRVVWLDAYPDTGTDGHVDGIAQYVRPGVLALLVPDDSGDVNYENARTNLERLKTTHDAKGRQMEVYPCTVTGEGSAGGHSVEMLYMNFYLANGAVVTPVGGVPSDEAALERLREVFPDREVVGVPGSTISYGGGGPHCITQQMPVGNVVAP
jgi:agmatine deiminase